MCFVKRRFDGLNGNVYKKFPECSSKSLKYFCGINLTQVVPFHKSGFSNKLEDDTIGLLNNCLYGKKWTGNDYIVKMLLASFSLQI